MTGAALIGSNPPTQNYTETGAVAGAAMSQNVPQNAPETGAGRAPPAPPTTGRRPLARLTTGSDPR